MKVLTEVRGHVLTIGINRPEKRNAFDLELIDQFGAAYQQLADDPDLRVAVVHAIGDHFSAGLDLAEVGAKVAEDGPRALSGGYDVDPFGVWAAPVGKPVVVAMQGICYTLSIELALASDIVVAASDSRFRQLEIARGIMPFGGATFRATAQLGWGTAMKFLLTAEEFDAATAHRIGLVQEVVAPGEQFDRALEIAQLIAAQAPLGVQASLANARVARDEGVDAARANLVQALEAVMRSEDAAEGVRSFVERRTATFSGR